MECLQGMLQGFPGLDAFPERLEASPPELAHGQLGVLLGVFDQEDTDGLSGLDRAYASRVDREGIT
jgi:hypothetical protein